MKNNMMPYSFIFIFIFLWSMITSLTAYNLPLDVVENLSWGQLWQWGYYKHPPLQAWQQEFMVLVFGRQDWPAFLLSYIYVGISFYLLYHLGRQLKLSFWLASFIPVAASGIYYYTLSAMEFNANVASLPLWLAYISVFIKACEDRRWFYWLLLAFVAALGLLAKYSFSVLLFSSLPAILCIRAYRPLLWHYGPYLSILLMFVFLYPHLRWLADNHFLPIQYLMRNAGQERNILSELIAPFIFALGQIGVVLPAGLILYMVAKPVFRRQYSKIQQLAGCIITFPLIVMMICGWVLHIRLHSFWGYSLPMVFILLGGMCFHWELRDSKYIKRVILIVLCLPLVSYLTIRGFSPYVRDKGSRIDYDGRAIAQEAQDYWKKATGETSLPKVITGDEHWVAENISWYSPKRPKVIVDGRMDMNPWAQKIELPRYILWIGLGMPNNELKGKLQHIQPIDFSWKNKKYTRENPYYFAIIDSQMIKK